MTDNELATKLLCVISQETLKHAKMFEYLCWLEESHQREAVPKADFLVLAFDGTTCWGKSYEQAVHNAMEHDKGWEHE